MIRWSCLHHSRADAIPNPVSFIIDFIRTPSGLLDSKLLAGNSTNVISKCVHTNIDQSMYVHVIVNKFVNKFHLNHYKKMYLCCFFILKEIYIEKQDTCGRNPTNISFVQKFKPYPIFTVCLFVLQL